MTDGYLYCFSNPSMPGLLKIGMTTRSPADRLNELCTTPVPTPFYCEFAKKVANVKQKEITMHKIFSNVRVNPQREFFRVSVSDVQLQFELMDGEMWNGYEEEPTESEKEVIEEAKQELCTSSIPLISTNVCSTDIARTRTTKNRPTTSELFDCFNQTTELRLRYGRHIFKGLIYKSKLNNKLIAINPETLLEEEVRSLGSWISKARDVWLKTTSNKNPYDVIDYKNIKSNEWISLIDITPESRYN